MPDIVSDLHNAAVVRVDLASIVHNASESMKFIESWRSASVNNSGMMSIIRKIEENGLIYYDAIDMSIKTAEDGHAFSSHVIDLCGYLLKPSTGLADILEYVETIRNKASVVHTESKETLEKFRTVREGLFKITQQIPVEMEKLRKAEDAPKLRTIFKLQSLSKKTDNVADTKERELECEAALAELQQAATHLEGLSQSLDEFVRWWVKTETLLLTAKGRGDSLNPEKVQRLVVIGMQQGWEKIRTGYLGYKNAIVQLQNCYPSAGQRKLLQSG